MSLPPDYLRYSHRRHGLDHDWFRYRSLAGEAPIAWPDGKRVALWVTVHAEHFPLDMAGKPVMPIGGMRYVPDFHGYSNRDYGNRIGIHRVMRLLDRYGIKATAAMNSDVARRYPALVDEILKRGWEVMASGVNMDRLHHGGLARADEAALVAEAVTTLRRVAPVRGWHSPAHSQSANTLDLIAAQGLDYIADWTNDDMPYPVTTPSGPLHAMPLSSEWADNKILHLHDRPLADYEDQVVSAFRVFDEEAVTRGGRILSLPLHPWVIGQPHRIAALERMLETIMGSGSVWPATGAEILDCYRRQAPAP